MTKLGNLFEQAQGDRWTLAMLKAELGQRGIRWARHLLENVENAMRSVGHDEHGAWRSVQLRCHIGTTFLPLM